MNEENDIYQQEIPMDEDIEPMMPDGYAEGDDFFEPDTWSGESESESAADESSTESVYSNPDETADTEAPAIGQTADDVSADDGTDAGAPATGAEPYAPTTRRVRYQFDHEDREEEISDADLPELLQKARSVDRYKERLDSARSSQDRLDRIARAMQYENGSAFLDAILENAQSSEMEALRGKGVPDEIAEDYIGRKYAEAMEGPYTEPAQPAPGRDFVAEATELLNVHPELAGRDLPQEVFEMAARPGVSLLQAYAEHERRVSRAEAEQARTEAEKLRKENRILKNNADSADRAPVSGVSKGGRASDNDADDPFLKGFNSVFD